jgi:hypothetical protein
MIPIAVRYISGTERNHTQPGICFVLVLFPSLAKVKLAHVFASQRLFIKDPAVWRASFSQGSTETEQQKRWTAFRGLSHPTDEHGAIANVWNRVSTMSAVTWPPGRRAQGCAGHGLRQERESLDRGGA